MRREDRTILWLAASWAACAALGFILWLAGAL